MDIITAIVEIIKAIAWPIAALIILSVLRRPLLDLIPFIRGLKLMGVEVTIAKDVAEAKSLAPPLSDEVAIKSGDSFIELDRKQDIYKLISLAPRAAISEAWRELETAAAAVVARLGPETLPSSLRAKMTFAEALRNRRLITADQFSAISKLRKIRNESVHLPDFTLDENVVRDYVDTAMALATEVASLQPTPPETEK